MKRFEFIKTLLLFILAPVRCWFAAKKELEYPRKTLVGRQMESPFGEAGFLKMFPDGEFRRFQHRGHNMVEMFIPTWEKAQGIGKFIWVRDPVGSFYVDGIPNPFTHVDVPLENVARYGIDLTKEAARRRVRECFDAFMDAGYPFPFKYSPKEKYHAQ